MLDRGRLVGEEYFGFADLDTKQKIDENTLYHWASITKTFTAIGILQLVERGLISLDDPVIQYIPELGRIHNPHGEVSDITLRHLITHTSGFRTPTWPFAGGENWQPHEPTDWSQLVAMMPYTKIHFEPGSQYAYSNPGITFLGRVIEVVTGEDVEAYLDKNLLKPLGMYNSYFDLTPWHLRERRSNNYIIKQDGLEAQGREFDTGITVANGGLNGPLPDMAKYLNFLLGVGDNEQYDTILPRAVLLEMFKPINNTATYPGTREMMGMGFFVLDHTGEGTAKPQRYVGHTGTQKAFRVYVYIHAESQSAAIMATNSRPEENYRQLYNNTRKWLFDNMFPMLIHD